MTDSDESAEHTAEAEERWGETEAYKESARRTQDYTKEDWARIQAEGDRIESSYAELFLSGRSPQDPASIAAAEAHRQHIERWFYSLSHAAHSELGKMYVTDARFTEHYDQRAPGLAAFIAAAIAANAAAHIAHHQG